MNKLSTKLPVFDYTLQNRIFIECILSITATFSDIFYAW